MDNTSITYCLRVKGTESLVRFSSSSNAGGYACVPVSYRLEAGRGAEDLPVYEQPDLAKLHHALLRNTPDYNADYDTPMHGEVEVGDLEIVERTRVDTFKVVKYEPPMEFRFKEQFRKPDFLLRRYAGVAHLPAGAEYLSYLELPEGETAESVKRFEGSKVTLAGGLSYSLTLVRIGLQLPEEFVDELGTKYFAAVTTERRFG
jgi:hypothetical protein